ncbi:MAG: 1-acyl-sn-glycerol-3-phosphate acyltransferase, partial [Verrucomicrobiota bacterium]
MHPGPRLRRGEVVCVCPEGHISRTGQLMRLHRGFEVIAGRAGAPVVAAAIDGLWGSIFSFAGNKCLWNSPRLLPTPVHVAFGRPQPAEQAGVEWARRELLDSGEKAFQERPVLRRHLGREAVRALAKQPGRVLVIDRTADRRVLSCAQIYAAAALLSRRLRERVPGRRVGIVLPPGAGGFIAN